MQRQKSFFDRFEQDDLIQEGMIGLYEAVKNFKNDRASF